MRTCQSAHAELASNHNTPRQTYTDDRSDAAIRVALGRKAPMSTRALWDWTARQHLQEWKTASGLAATYAVITAATWSTTTTLVMALAASDVAVAAVAVAVAVVVAEGGRKQLHQHRRVAKLCSARGMWRDCGPSWNRQIS